MKALGPLVWSNYLDVNADYVAVRPFLQAVGGDTTVAEATGGETILVRGETDCDGQLVLRWGVQDLAGAPGSDDTEEIHEYANQAAMEAAGWSFTDTQSPPAAPGTSFGFATATDVGPYGTSFRLTTHNPGYFSGITGQVRAEKTFAVTPAASYTVKVWTGAQIGNAWYSTAVVTVTSGANTWSEDINGTEADQELTVPIVAGAATLTVRLSADASNIYSPSQSWYFAALNFLGLGGGGAEVDFSDIPYCVGTGTGQTGGAA